MIAGSMLETPRLVVRPFVATDAPMLVRLFADPAVYRFVGEGVPLSAADARDWVIRSGENLKRFGYGTGAVVRRAQRDMIGWAGFARPGDGSEEVIYGFAAAHWRQGYGAELLRALLAFADARGMAAVRATVDPANAASVRLLAAAGFALAERSCGGDAESDLYVRRGGRDA